MVKSVFLKLVFSDSGLKFWFCRHKNFVEFIEQVRELYQLLFKMPHSKF